METKLMICPVCGGTLVRKANQYLCDSCGTAQEILNEQQAVVPPEIWTEAQRLVNEAQRLAGEKGLIECKIAAGYRCDVTTELSAFFPCGYASPRFAGDDESVVCWEAKLLTVTGKSTLRSLLPILEQIIAAVPEAAVVFFGDGVDTELLETLAINWERGTLHCMAVLLPEDAPARERLLGTLSRLGSRILDSAADTVFSVQDLGYVRRAVFTPEKTYMIDENVQADTPVVTVHAGGKNEKEQKQLLKACQILRKEGECANV